MKKSLFVFFLVNILIIFFFLGIALLLKEPPIWPDEAIYADIVTNLIKEKRLGTDLWQGTIPGVENYALWYPPVFFYFLFFWFKIFGFSIINQRILSFLIAIIVLIFYSLLVKKIINIDKSKTLFPAVVSLFALVVDVVFLKASRVSRPEIFILFFGFLSFWFFWQSLNHRRSFFFVILSGLFSALAFLTHTIALFIPISILSFVLVKKKLPIFFSHQFYLFLVSFFMPIFIWFISIFPYFEILKKQMALAIQRKNLEWPWLWIALHDQPLTIKLIIVLYLVLTFLFLIISLMNKNDSKIFLTLIILFSWVFSTYGRMFWYFVFPVPFIYFSFALTFSEIKNNFFRQIYMLIFIFLIALNIKLNIDFISTQSNQNYSYNRFINNILKIVPENKTVFLSSIPDPYFGFKEKRGNKNRLYQFPVLKTEKEKYIKILNKSDYIIYTGSYETLIFGDLQQKYIEKNKEIIYPINEPYQYQALIIKLKPKNQRLSP